ncbi:hypothetical protein GC169_04865 [bacterium]|nr:hypothetical protein [bacterium]
MMVTTLIAAAAEPLSLAEAKAYLRIGYDDEDELVGQLAGAARARIEAAAGVALINRTLRWRIDAWPKGAVEQRAVRLPVRPAAQLVAVRVTAGGTQGDVTERFTLDGGRAARIVWTSGAFPWTDARASAPAGPQAGGVEIDWVAGFGPAPGDVPADLKLAVRRLLAHAYHARDSETIAGPLPVDVAGLIAPWRRVRL